jgi:hypothetical protein
MEMVTVKLFGINEIRDMMGTTMPIEGCMIVQFGLKRKQIAFTNERPNDAQWLWFEYETEPRDCLPLFEQRPVYGVLLGDVEGPVHEATPIAELSPTRYVQFGVACFTRDGEERRLYIRIDDRAYYVLNRDSIMKLGDRVIVHFPYNPQKVETAKALGGKFFPYLKAWVFPAEREEKVKEALLR